jgi:sulfotransferase
VRAVKDRQIVYVTGLARSGSTLLCQLLAQHPDVHSTAHSSPLCHALNHLRRQMSDDPFLLSQLDSDFERVYARLTSAFRGFVDGWFAETDKRWVVDKNRGWLGMLETVRHLDPSFRMLVCVRELTQIYGSIESRHQETILLDFPDHLADRSRYARADALFAPNGVIGRPLRALQSVQDLDEAAQQRLYYVVFEDLMGEPQRVLRDLFAWLGLPAAEIDTDDLALQPTESDSHYRFKYPHRVRSRIAAPAEHRVPERIARQIRRNYRWYYELFYPGVPTD